MNLDKDICQHLLRDKGDGNIPVGEPKNGGL